MPIATIGIEVQTRSIDQAERKLDGLGDSGERAEQRLNQSTRRASTSFDGLTTAIGIATTALASAAAVTTFLQIADEVDLLEARVARYTSTQEQANTLFNSLGDIARRTGTELDTVVGTFARFAPIRKTLGATNAELGQFTETLVNLGRLGGSSTQEINNALRQLSQGFSAGIIRAEEYNSVIENTPEIIIAYANATDRSLGEVRQQLLAGELDARAFFNAIQSQAENVNEEIGKIPRTVNQAATSFGQELSRVIDRIDDATGTSSALTQTLSDTADVFAAFGGDIGTLEEANRILQRTNELVGESRERADSLSGILFRAQAEFFGLFTGARDAAQEQVDALQRLADAQQEVIDNQPEPIPPGVASSISALNAEIDKLQELSGVSAREQFILTEQLRAGAEEGTAGAISIRRLANNLFDLKEAQSDTKAADRLNTANEKILTTLENQVIALTATRAKQLELAAAQRLGADATDKQIRKFIELNETLDEATELQSELREESRRLARIQREQERNAEAQARQLQQVKDRLDPVNAAYREYQETLALLQANVTDSTELTRLSALALEEFQTATQKATQEAEPFGQVWKDTASSLNRTFEDLFDGAFDNFESFKDSVQRGARELAATLANQLGGRALASILGVGGAGANQGIGGVLLSALGGGGGAGGGGGSGGGGGLQATSSIASLVGSTGILSGAGAAAGLGTAFTSGLSSAVAGGIGGLGTTISSIGTLATSGSLAGVATALGAAVPIIGGVIAIASLFSSSKPSNKEGNVTINPTTGEIIVGGQTGSKFSQENRDAANTLGGAALSSLQSLQAFTGSTFSENFRIATGSRDPAVFSIGAREGQGVANRGRIIAQGSPEEVLAAAVDTFARELGIDGRIFREFQASGELITDTVNRIIAQTTAYADVTQQLGLNYDLTGDAAIRAVQTITEAAGGLDSLTANLNLFGQKFASATTDVAAQGDALAAEFEALGFTLPQTREEFANMVQGIDQSTEAGQRLFGQLISLTGATDSYIIALEQQAATQQQIINDLSSATDAAFDAVQSVVNERIEALQTDFNAQTSAIDQEFNARIQAARQSGQAQAQAIRSQVAGVTQSVRELTTLANSLRGAAQANVVETQELNRQRREQAQAQLAAALGRARVGGSVGDISGAIGILGQQDQSLFGSFGEFALDAAITANRLAELADLTEQEANAQQSQIGAINAAANAAAGHSQVLIARLEADRDAQKQDLQDIFDAQVTELEQTLLDAEKQRDALRGIDNSVLSLDEKLERLDTALTEEAAARGVENTDRIVAAIERLETAINNADEMQQNANLAIIQNTRTTADEARNTRLLEEERTTATT